MKKIIWMLVMLWATGFACPAGAGLLDDILEPFSAAKGGVSRSGPDERTAVSGLKEALSIGTKNAVKAVSGKDGYFGNRMVKILLPENIQMVADAAARLGFQKEVDRFILSMNRAAEAAAPAATDLFVDSIRRMSFDDARKILQGGDTAATDFFKDKTSKQLYEALPLASKQSLDLDHYVTSKALDGLFVMVGEEEKKIRTDPAARVTDILKTVFGK